MPAPTTTTPAARFRAAHVGVRVGVFWLVAGTMFAVLATGPWPPMPFVWARQLVLGLLATAGGLAITRACVAGSAEFAGLGMAVERASFARCLLGFVTGLGLALLHFAVIQITTGGLGLVRVPGVGLETLGFFGAVYLALSAMEEVAFRGFPLRALLEEYGLWPAQIVVALVFALYHILGGQDVGSAILGTGMGSLLFGMAAVASRGLAVPIGLHAAWNYAEWAVGGKGEPGPWRLAIDESTTQAVQTTAHVSYIAVLGGATFVFWLRWRTAERS